VRLSEERSDDRTMHSAITNNPLLVASLLACRCPELLLAPHVSYTDKVDLWSVGCIFAEMVLREPLFPGRSYVHQVQLILENIGTPPSSEAMGFTPRKDAAAYLKRQKVKVGKSWAEILPDSRGSVVDLIASLLVFNPSKRSSAGEAMEHPYFEGTPELPCEREGKTPGGKKFVTPQEVDFKFDNDNIGLEELKAMIQGEVEICRAMEKGREEGEQVAVGEKRPGIGEGGERVSSESESESVSEKSPANSSGQNSPVRQSAGGIAAGAGSAGEEENARVEEVVKSPVTNKGGREGLINNKGSSKKVLVPDGAGGTGGNSMLSPVIVPSGGIRRKVLQRTGSSGRLIDRSGTGGITMKDGEGESRVRSRLENAIREGRGGG